MNCSAMKARMRSVANCSTSTSAGSSSTSVMTRFVFDSTTLAAPGSCPVSTIAENRWTAPLRLISQTGQERAERVEEVLTYRRRRHRPQPLDRSSMSSIRRVVCLELIQPGCTPADGDGWGRLQRERDEVADLDASHESPSCAALLISSFSLASGYASPGRSIMSSRSLTSSGSSEPRPTDHRAAVVEGKLLPARRASPLERARPAP